MTLAAFEGYEPRGIKCLVWAGAGILRTVAGGVPRLSLISQVQAAAMAGFSFVQISDKCALSHAKLRRRRLIYQNDLRRNF